MLLVYNALDQHDALDVVLPGSKVISSGPKAVAVRGRFWIGHQVTDIAPGNSVFRLPDYHLYSEDFPTDEAYGSGGLGTGASVNEIVICKSLYK
jgi:hypothetical protein